MAYSGWYYPKNIKKYKGDYKKIRYRSLWELKLFKYCDHSTHIKRWNSEEVVIPYRCATDNKIHRYFMDVWVELAKPNKDGFTEMLIEVKPFQQTQEPKPPKSGRKTKKYIQERLTYDKNQSKWKAAKKYCDRLNMGFLVMTEYGLGIKKKQKKS